MERPRLPGGELSQHFPVQLQQLRTDQGRRRFRCPRPSQHQRVLPLSARAPLPLSQNSTGNSEATMELAVEPHAVKESAVDLRGF